MTDRVLLHVGEPKCGTTFLQQVMWAGRTPLAAHGIVLPGLTAAEQFRATQDLREVPQPAADPGGSWHGEWDTLAREARTSSAPVAVISHELLAEATAEQAARAVRSLAPAQVHVIVTVRDLATLLPAEWQETVKHENRQSWEDWLAEVIDEPAEGSRFWAAHDTPAVLRRWAADLPPERVHVVIVPRADAPKDLLWTRFASALGVQPDVVDTAVARPNTSLGPAEAELLRRLNERLVGDRALPQWFYTGHVKEALAHQVLGRRAQSGRLVLPTARQAWATVRSEEIVAGVRDAGYDVVGDLDELRPATVPGASVSPGDVGDTELLDVALDALQGLLHERYAAVTTRPRLRDLAGGGVLKFPGAYRARRIGYDLAAGHRSVAALRVLVWRATQWLRSRS